MAHAQRQKYRITDYEQEYLTWYLDRSPAHGIPFDPMPLVRLAEVQWPEWPFLLPLLEQCTQIWPHNELYSYFVPRPVDVTTWRHYSIAPLKHPTLGTLFVDVQYHTQDQERLRISGVEYFDNAKRQPHGPHPPMPTLVTRSRLHRIR